MRPEPKEFKEKSGNQKTWAIQMIVMNRSLWTNQNGEAHQLKPLCPNIEGPQWTLA